MKRKIILTTIVASLMIIIAGCEKDYVTTISSDTEIALLLTDVKMHPMKGITVREYFTNLDTTSCGGIDTAGTTTLRVGYEVFSFDWARYGYTCPRVYPSKIEVVNFSQFTLVLVDNQPFAMKRLIILESGYTIRDTLIDKYYIRSLVYVNKKIKLTCRNAWVRNETLPDSYIIVDL